MAAKLIFFDAIFITLFSAKESVEDPHYLPEIIYPHKNGHSTYSVCSLTY